MLRGDFRTECNMDGCWYWRDWDTLAEAEADCNKHAKRKHGLNGWGLYCAASVSLRLPGVRKPRGSVPMGLIPIPA